MVLKVMLYALVGIIILTIISFILKSVGTNTELYIVLFGVATAIVLSCLKKVFNIKF